MKLALKYGWLALFLFTFICGLIQGRKPNFVPGVDYLEIMQFSSYVISFALVLPALFIPIPSESMRETKLWKFTLVFALMSLIFFFLIRELFLTAVPAVLHKFSGKVLWEGAFVVRKKQYDYSCQGALYAEYPVIGILKICGIGQEGWEAVDDGDLIMLRGKSSIWGAQYESVELNRM